VIAGRVFGFEVAVDRGEGVAQDVGLCEAVGAGRGGAASEAGVSRPEDVDGAVPGVPYALPGDGGSSETAANELTMSPSGVSSISVVMKATPVANRPKAARRLGSSRPASAVGMAWAVGMAQRRAWWRPRATSPRSS
jgi:hypothetical protein